MREQIRLKHAFIRALTGISIDSELNRDQVVVVFPDVY